MRGTGVGNEAGGFFRGHSISHAETQEEVEATRSQMPYYWSLFFLLAKRGFQGHWEYPLRHFASTQHAESFGQPALSCDEATWVWVKIEPPTRVHPSSVTHGCCWEAFHIFAYCGLVVEIPA